MVMVPDSEITVLRAWVVAMMASGLAPRLRSERFSGELPWHCRDHRVVKQQKLMPQAQAE
jgi:hypothetical protein